MTHGGTTALGDDGIVVPEEHLTLRDAPVGYFYGSPNFSVRNTGRSSHRGVDSVSSEISSRLRWTVNGLAMMSCFLFSGILFGWAPLKMILIREGQFRGTCGVDDDVSNDTPCTNQLVEFNFIFTVAQFCLNLASLPVGFFLDHASKTLHFFLAGLLTVRIVCVRARVCWWVWVCVCVNLSVVGMELHNNKKSILIYTSVISHLRRLAPGQRSRLVCNLRFRRIQLLYLGLQSIGIWRVHDPAGILPRKLFVTRVPGGHFGHGFLSF